MRLTLGEVRPSCRRDKAKGSQRAEEATAEKCERSQERGKDSGNRKRSREQGEVILKKETVCNVTGKKIKALVAGGFQRTIYLSRLRILEPGAQNSSISLCQ